MQSKSKTPAEYINELPEERKKVIKKLREEIKKNLPKGFKEVMSYGMIGYVVPHSLYPKGYHVNPELPLPFMSLASQKNYISFYHMGLYSGNSIYDWFVKEYPKHANSKLDMGQCCVRFKKMDDIPYKLIGEMCGKITPQKWIEIYESALKQK